MRLRDDEDDYGRSGIKLPTVILIASASIFAILAIVLFTNSRQNKKSDYFKNQQLGQQTIQEEVTETDTKTAADLDFWNMYDEGSDTSKKDYSGIGERREELENREEEMKPKQEEELPQEDENDPSTDGKHVEVVHADGSSEWLTINSSLKTNTYEDTSFEKANGIIGYYSNGKKTTKTGVDISQYTSEVGWSTIMQEADYVMIRVGARGYDSGNIISDTKFIEYVTAATRAGVPYGLYFSSQAVTEEEAKQEAQFVLSQIATAQTAVATMNTNSNNNSNTGNTNNNINNNNNNNNNNTNNGNNSNNPISNNTNVVNSTPTNYVMGVPYVFASIHNTAEDNDGNKTTIYMDGTAVTRYANGDIVTAYSNGSEIHNYSNGNIEKKDGNGNTIVIDSKGNYSATNAAGNVTASGVTNQTTGYDGSTNNNINNNYNNTNNNNTNNGNINNTNNGTANNGNINNNTNGNNTNAVSPNGYYNFKLSYPIAVDMHLVANDVSRVDKLNSTERTALVKTFCDTIKAAGYTPIIYGDKEMLLTKINMSALDSYGVWLSNEGDLPKYPYLMSMWRYNSTGNLIKSASGEYGVSCSFIDYSSR